MQPSKETKNELGLIISNDLGSFFDLLAKFDFEDKKKLGIDKVSLSKNDRETLSVTKNRDKLGKNSAVRTSDKTCSPKSDFIKK